MKLIEGFQRSRALLSREAPPQSFPISPGMKEGLKKLFGTEDPEQAVRQIIGEVQRGGDSALIALTLRIDRIKLTNLEVGQVEIKAAYGEVKPELVSALKLAAERIRSFHQAQKDKIWHEVAKNNLGQLIRPLARIGAYVPGGTASYPSTVLMTAVPARVAGVKEIILTTPPKANGTVPAATLVAADIAGVDRVFRVGGAQAIAALAYGTESIPRVDKICGPGNIFVVLAKKLVYGVVAVDGLPGPSEVIIIADETSNAKYCAADLLAQAEHDNLASAVLVTTSRPLADAVINEVEKQLAVLPRKAIAAEALERGIIAIVSTLDEAIELSNLYAPEHLCLMTDKAKEYLDKIKNAGCVITGREATVVLGDYVAGPSHVLPTGGTARFGSPLNIADFLKFINTINVDRSSLNELAEAASIIARAEGLDAHARAAEMRIQD